jgi:hypothetical protein
MKWRIINALSILFLVALVVLWVGDGRQVYTKTAIQYTVKDELFGTESVEWKEGLWIGLDVAGPSGGLLAALALFSMIRSRRQRKAH